MLSGEYIPKRGTASGSWRRMVPSLGEAPGALRPLRPVRETGGRASFPGSARGRLVAVAEADVLRRRAGLRGGAAVAASDGRRGPGRMGGGAQACAPAAAPPSGEARRPVPRAPSSQPAAPITPAGARDAVRTGGARSGRLRRHAAAEVRAPGPSRPGSPRRGGVSARSGPPRRMGARPGARDARGHQGTAQANVPHPHADPPTPAWRRSSRPHRREGRRRTTGFQSAAKER